MSRLTIIDNEYATLYYYPEQKLVHHMFHKYIYGQEFRAVLEKGLEIFRQNGAEKWLSDDRANSALPAEDVEWGAVHWFPKVFASGWKYWAVVLPDKVVGQVNMNRIMNEYVDRGLRAQAFTDPDEALQWLETI